jgi:hypothetical protein
MGHEVKQAKWASEILAYALDTLKKNGVVTKKELCKKVKDAHIETIQRPKKKERLKTKEHCNKNSNIIFSKATTLRGWA